MPARPTTVRFSFGELIVLEEDLGEVVIDDGIETDVDMLHEYHRVIMSALTPPYRLLINKVHQYTYTFEAQLSIAAIPNMGVIAVITPTLRSTYATQSLLEMPRTREWHVRIFRERPEALEWLESHKGEVVKD